MIGEGNHYIRPDFDRAKRKGIPEVILADGKTVSRAKSLGLEADTHLEKNDSYPFFQRLDDLLMTGPTLTNVMDLHLMIVRIAPRPGGK